MRLTSEEACTAHARVAPNTPDTLHIFNAQMTVHLLYGIQIWLSAFNSEVERVELCFLYKIFGIAHCVSYAALCLEAGQVWLEPNQIS